MEGIDLEFTKNGNYYIVEIKSGPNWGNSSQIKKMKDNFKKAEEILLAKDKDLKILAVNGCCYGIENQPDKDGYQKICGQEFWQLISDSDTLYTDIVESLGHQAKEKNEEFLKAYAKVVNQFTLKFASNFCDDGEINWQKIVAFNSKNLKQQNQANPARGKTQKGNNTCSQYHICGKLDRVVRIIYQLLRRQNNSTAINQPCAQASTFLLE